MTYIDCLKTQARTAWTTWYDASDRACQATATAWEWYTDTFFSDEATARYRGIGEGLGLLMVCTVSLGVAARSAWEAWRETEEAQALTELAAEAVEVARPHVEQLAYRAINTVARPVLNILSQAQELETEVGEDDFRIESLADNTEWLEYEPVVDAFNAEVADYREQFADKEIPELLLYADQLGVAIPTVQCSKSQLISLIWEAF